MFLQGFAPLEIHTLGLVSENPNDHLCLVQAEHRSRLASAEKRAQELEKQAPRAAAFREGVVAGTSWGVAMSSMNFENRIRLKLIVQYTLQLGCM